MKHAFKKVSLILSITLFISSCGVFLFVFREIDKNIKKGEQLQIEWRKEDMRRDEIKSFDRSFKAIEGQSTELETHFAKSSDIVPFLNSLEGTATLAHVKAEVSSVDVLSDKTGLGVSMNAHGNFSQIYKFLTLLENFPYELEILSVDLRKGGAPEALGQSDTLPNWVAIFRIKLLSFTQ